MQQLMTENENSHRVGKHWEILDGLLLEGEWQKEPIQFINEMTLDEYNEGDEEDYEDHLISILIDNVIDWLTYRYIKLRSMDLYPEEWTFVSELTQEKALLFQKQIDVDYDDNNIYDEEIYNDYEDFMLGVNECYSYGDATGSFGNNILEYQYNRENFIYIETSIIACCLEVLSEEGWFVTWRDEALTAPPFEEVW